MPGRSNILPLNFNPDILNGQICPYCGNKTEYVDSEQLYGRSFGMVYACIPCNARIGVHRGTDQALGRLANQELGQWKRATHDLFDPLRKKLINYRMSVSVARKACYTWLSKTLDIPFEYTHIGMFDVDQCKAAHDAMRAMLESEKGLQQIISFNEADFDCIP